MPEIRITFEREWSNKRRIQAMDDRHSEISHRVITSIVLEREGYPDVDYSGSNDELRAADSILITFAS